jgi:hypothetical protein
MRIGLPVSNDTLLRGLKKDAQPAVTGAQVIDGRCRRRSRR